MLDDDSNSKENGGQKKPPGKSFNNVPIYTMLAWAGIIAAAVGLWTMRQHITTPAGATIVVNQQSLPLTEINGSYLRVEKDGKVTKDEIPFVVHNAWLTPEMLNTLERSIKITNNAPNVVVMNLVWGIAPFLILGVLFWFFFIRQLKAAGKGA